MSDTAPRTPGRGRGPVLDWKAVLGILISLGLLYFAFRDVQLAEVVDNVRRADLLLLLGASLAVTLVFPLRAVRWKPLLDPVSRTAFRSRFAATNIGFMANNLLPARVGEFARALALARMERVTASAAFGSLVVERLFDGVTVVVFLIVALLSPGFPGVSTGGRDFGTVALTAGLIMLGAGVVLLLLTLRPTWFIGLVGRVARAIMPDRLADALVAALESFIGGLEMLRHPRLAVRVAFWSLTIWLVNSLGFYLGFLAFGIDVPFIGAVFLNSVIALAVALPSAPGFFGLFEAGARVGLVDVWGVDPTVAVSFAIGFHIAGFLPVTLIGLYDAWRLGLSFAEVEHSEELVEEATETAGDEGPDT